MTTILIAAILAGSAEDASAALALAQAQRLRQEVVLKSACPCGCGCPADQCFCRDGRRCSSGCDCDLPAIQPAVRAGLEWAKKTGWTPPEQYVGTPAPAPMPVYHPRPAILPAPVPAYRPTAWPVTPVQPTYRPMPVARPAPAYHAPMPAYRPMPVSVGRGRAGNC